MLEDYQNTMTEFVKRVPRCALWVPMGAGKTGSTLTALVDLLDSLDIAKTLLIAPLRVAEKTWADEIADWTHTRGLRFMFLSGSKSAMLRKIEKNIDGVDIMAVSCDSVHVLAEIYLGRRPPWDTIIIDEASRFKNGTAKRTRALTLLTIHPHRVIELTGTPSPNGVKDIWSQIYMLDRGERLGRSMKAFKDKFFQTAAGTTGNKPSHVGEIRIQKAISDIVYVLQPEDFKSERKPLSNYIKLDLTPKLKEAYERFERKYVLELIDGGEITALNSAALTRKLMQFSSGAIYDADGVVQHVHDIKLDALQEIAEDNAGKSLLVAYNFKHEIARIKERFPHAELFGKDPKQQDRWNAGEIPMLLVHPKSAGHGLNLQFGGHILIWYSFDYNLEEYQQLNKRLPRKGQQHQVIIHHLVMRKTIDDIVLKALGGKDHAQARFQAELKKHILELIASLTPAERRLAA